MGVSERVISALKSDYRQAEVPEQTRALLAYAVKLTVSPAAITKGDVELLLACGYSDEQIVSAVMVTGYFNFINRVADGLGVDLEPEMKP